jgi:hypothetical protein
MDKLTKEEMNIVKRYEDVYKMIITNKSYSNLTFKFKEDLERIANAHKILMCRSCNSGIFTAVHRIWGMYIAQLAENNKKAKSKKANGGNSSEKEGA